MLGKKNKRIADLVAKNEQLLANMETTLARLASANDDLVSLRMHLSLEVARSRSLQRLVVLHACPGESFCENGALFSTELIKLIKEESKCR